jgi:telomerase reverse transcriptase
MRKRKRNRSGHSYVEGSKRRRVVGASIGGDAVVKQAVLAQYYRQVLSLREYLLAKLPRTSKIRRKKILFIGNKYDDDSDSRSLPNFLDQTLIGVSKCTELSSTERWQQRATFTQRADDSTSTIDASGSYAFSQSEVSYTTFFQTSITK